MSGHKKKKKAEEENAERWLLTYADMITLLVAFFMMMYSMSVINLEKFKKAAIGIRSGFNSPAVQDKMSGDSIVEKGSKPTIAPEPPMVIQLPEKKDEAKVERARTAAVAAAVRTKQQEQRNQRINALSKKFSEKINEVSPGRVAKVIPTSKGVAIEMIGDLIFFPKGTAQLSDEAKKVLRAAISVLTSVPNEISVEGHTSAGKVAGANFIDNWELSTARATTVVKFLLSTGVLDPKRISVTGYGEYRPLNQDDTSGAPLEHNDRVRVFIFQE
jgi:chemotaxis protein MotB